jgi:hypothetical protein
LLALYTDQASRLNKFAHGTLRVRAKKENGAPARVRRSFRLP